MSSLENCWRSRLVSENMGSRPEIAGCQGTVLKPTRMSATNSVPEDRQADQGRISASQITVLALDCAIHCCAVRHSASGLNYLGRTRVSAVYANMLGLRLPNSAFRSISDVPYMLQLITVQQQHQQQQQQYIQPPSFH